MEAIIEDKIKQAKINEMKEPVILMNDKDLEDFIKKINNITGNTEILKKPKYRGIPIKTDKFLLRNTVIVYDNFNNPFK